MSKAVFISHAVKDRDLARAVVGLIEEGIGVPEGEIFCSSLEGYGIPSGESFVAYMKGQLEGPEVVVLLLTPAYLESRFCLSELGGAWIKSHRLFPILTPPLTHADVKDVLLGTQVTKIDDDIGYNELRDYLLSKVDCNKTTLTKWDTKRRAFLAALPALLAKLAAPAMVSATVHDATLARLAEAQAELDDNEQELTRLKAQLAETVTLKDRAEVAAVAAKHAPPGAAGLDEEFRRLLKSVGQARTSLGRPVLTMALCDRYGLPYTIERGDQSVFEDAARRRYIDPEDFRVLWSAPPMKKLDLALSDVEGFMRANQVDLEPVLEGQAADPRAQDFWVVHYGL